MNTSTLIHTAALLAIGFIIIAASTVQSTPLNSKPAVTTASPLAIYAHDVGKAMRRAETGVLSMEDR